MGSESPGRGKWVVAGMAALMIGGAIAATYMMHIPTSELVGNLDGADPDKVSYDLEILKDRHEPAGIEKARGLLKSGNADVAACAAIYLGAMGKSEAVPYLIRALPDAQPQTEEGAVRKQEILAELTELTKQNIGGNAGAWRAWLGSQAETRNSKFE